MPNAAPIDTSGLLTILGLVAAVWALVPASARLQFRLSVTWIDWTVVAGVVLTTHYLVFEPVFRAAGVFYTLGNWRWGLDRNSFIYLLLLGLAIYILVRARTPRLARGKIEILTKLADGLLLARRYDELTALIEPQLSKLLDLVRTQPIPIRILCHANEKLRTLLTGDRATISGKGKRLSGWAASITASASARASRSTDQAKLVLRRLANSRPFAHYVANAQPDFGLRLIEAPETAKDDFVHLFVDSLLADSSSELYSELKNNENLAGRHRLWLPPTNRILYFFFKDVAVAAHHQLYRAIGESVLRRIDEDHALAETYNQPLGYFEDAGKHQSPIYAGIKLFEIMIHEGIHQGHQDHLWLFYFTHFTDHILRRMRTTSPSDSEHEFPTPFYYLLYQIVSIASNWVEDAIEVDTSKIDPAVAKKAGFNIHFIPEKSANAVGSIIEEIIMSPRVDDRFKHYMLEIVLRRYERLSDESTTQAVSRGLIRSLLDGRGRIDKARYRRELIRIYSEIDQQLRERVAAFDAAIKNAVEQDLGPQYANEAS